MIVDAQFSYTNLYANYTLLEFPPEAFYFQLMNTNEFLQAVTTADVYQSMNATGLFNPKVLQDIWLDYYDPNWSNVFTSSNSVYYFRYLALNFGLGGFFKLLTPRQVIEGYQDAVLIELQQRPVYMGGDLTVDPWVSIDNNPVSKPANAEVTFNTGTDNSTMTRQFEAWLYNS
jgi:hypothetical protein